MLPGVAEAEAEATTKLQHEKPDSTLYVNVSRIRVRTSVYVLVAELPLAVLVISMMIKASYYNLASCPRNSNCFKNMPEHRYKVSPRIKVEMTQMQSLNRGFFKLCAKRKRERERG